MGRGSARVSLPRDRSPTRRPCWLRSSPGVWGASSGIHVSRAGGGPERLKNVLRRLDRKRVWGQLRLVEGIAAAAAPLEGESPEPTPSLAAGWDATVAALPPDWSDLLCELMLGASDLVPRAALLGAPLNPTRNPDATALRFRVSGKQGYGASPGMARRCFERMDAEGISGRITVLNALSDTENAVTQGPVWRVAGRSV